MSAQRVLLSAITLLASTGSMFAQSVLSARSGTLHHFDGVVTVNDKAVEQRPGKFLELKDGNTLRTQMGRAEILLTPGVFLRIGENSAVKMIDSRLMSTRVEFLGGSAMIESDDADVSVRDPAVTIIYNEYELQPVKFGLFELTSTPNQVRVFKGQAAVTAGGNRVIVKEGRQLPFSAALLVEKFDDKNVDDLYLWTRDRSSHLSAANMASARSVANQSMTGGSMFGGNGYLNTLGGFSAGMSGSWYYNPYLGMYTYLPRDGTAWSPFGYGYFSPYSIYAYYSPGRYYWNGGGSARNGGATGVPLTAIGTSGVAASQVARVGSGFNTHPTMSSPVRSVDSPAMGSGFRGMESFGMPNPGGVMYGAQSSGTGRGFDNSAVSGRFGGGGGGGGSVSVSAPAAPVSAPAAAPESGGGPGGARGR